MRTPSFSKILRAASFAAACFAQGLGQPSVAAASPTYPATVAAALDVPCTPKCTLCHTRPTGGFATVNTPFGLTVRMQHGLECCNPALLRDVLAEIRDEETDSDDDGVSDVDELQALTSPNTADDVDLACEPAQSDSGCSATDVGAAHETLPPALLLAAVLIVVAAARRFA